MKSLYFYFFIALAAGAMIPTQAAVNNRLAAFLESPILSALFSFIIGTTALLIYALISGESLSRYATVSSAPPIALIGGLLGAFFVTASVMLLPRLGVAMTFSLVIAGQMIVTLIIDHYGLLGVPVKEINFGRIGGILLVVLGVILVRRY